MKRLRVAQVIVKPVLMWDDGDDLTPGPELQEQALNLRQLADLLEKLPAQVADLESQLLAAETTAETTA